MTSTESVSYDLLYRQCAALLDAESDGLANLANLTALLFAELKNINWLGFYLRKDTELVLGPFQGKVACTRIPIGKGVCGSAAATNTVYRVADVHDFQGHIACDSASNSELVIPVVQVDYVVAVLDIDSPEFDRFSEEDEAGLMKIADLTAACFPLKF